VVYAGESKSQNGKEVIVAEIFPDFDALKEKGIHDVQEYFEERIKEINSRMVVYKAVKKVKIREEEFPKNTGRQLFL
jgi:long-chain acyl-CoA synthetase